jgi:flagella basal body P-ring formation protein FlgA
MSPSAIMKTVLAYLLALCCLATAQAQTQEPRQDPAALRRVVEQFLQTRSTGLPGQVEVSVGAIDPRLNLPTCPAPEAFLSGASRAWGKTTVGVRCSAPASWTIYVPATVKVMANYLVTAAPLAQGQPVEPNDVALVRGDLTRLPPGIITETSQAVGRTMAVSLPLGTPLRADSLRSQQAVQQGQVVRLVSSGNGFRISAEARALTNGTEGQVVQARTASGQMVSGVAKAGGVVEVVF